MRNGSSLWNITQDEEHFMQYIFVNEWGNSKCLRAVQRQCWYVKVNHGYLTYSWGRLQRNIWVEKFWENHEQIKRLWRRVDRNKLKQITGYSQQTCQILWTCHTKEASYYNRTVGGETRQAETLTGDRPLGVVGCRIMCIGICGQYLRP